MRSQVLTRQSVEVSKVVQLCIATVVEDAFSTALSSTVSSMFLLSLVTNPKRKEFSACINAILKSNSQYIERFKKIMLENKEFTKCNYIVQLVSELNIFTEDNLILDFFGLDGSDLFGCKIGDLKILYYLNECNISFKSLYQLSSIQCSLELVLNKSFLDQKLLFVQITDTTLAIWHQENNLQLLFFDLWGLVSFSGSNGSYELNFDIQPRVNIESKNVFLGKIRLNIVLQKEQSSQCFDLNLKQAFRFCKPNKISTASSPLHVGSVVLSDPPNSSGKCLGEQKEISETSGHVINAKLLNILGSSKPKLPSSSTPAISLRKLRPRYPNKSDSTSNHKKIEMKLTPLNQSILQEQSTMNLFPVSKASKSYGKKKNSRCTKDMWELSSDGPLQNVDSVIPKTLSSEDVAILPHTSTTSCSIIEDSQFQFTPFPNIKHTPVVNLAGGGANLLPASKLLKLNQKRSSIQSNTYSDDELVFAKRRCNNRILSSTSADSLASVRSLCSAAKSLSSTLAEFVPKLLSENSDPLSQKSQSSQSERNGRAKPVNTTKAIKFNPTASKDLLNMAEGQSSNSKKLKTNVLGYDVLTKQGFTESEFPIANSTTVDEVLESSTTISEDIANLTTTNEQTSRTHPETTANTTMNIEVANPYQILSKGFSSLSSEIINKLKSLEMSIASKRQEMAQDLDLQFKQIELSYQQNLRRLQDLYGVEMEKLFKD